jgi:hypothetical protein
MQTDYKKMNLKGINFFILWALTLFFGLIIFQFLHECGHGFGSQLDGVHVSTGFSRVGDAGKRPSDPDFRSDEIEKGIISSGGLLGPFINWMLAIFFTAWLLHRKRANLITLLIGVGAVANALMRLLAMLLFIVGAFLGRVHLEDEVCWGIQGVHGIKMPMAFSEFRMLVKTQPGLFLSEPRFYFWPLLSFSIVVFCFIIAYRRLYTIFDIQLSTKLNRWVFGLMPIVVIPPMFLLCSWLDNLLRINW